MLAKTLKLSIVGLLVGATSFCSTSASGQQLLQPSQRYQPTEVAQVPPSVHVAPPQAQRIPTSSYNFSDQAHAQQPGVDNRYLIQQVAYQQPVAPATNEPVVPAILAGAPAMGQVQQAAQKLAAPVTAKVETVSQALNQFTPKVAAEKSFKDFAPQMQQVIKTNTPRIAPEEISSQRAVLESQLKAIKQRTAARQAELALLAKREAAQVAPQVKQSISAATLPAAT